MPSHDIQLSFIEANAHSQFSIEIFPYKNEKERRNQIALLKEYEKLNVKSVNVTCKTGQLEPSCKLISLIRAHTSLVVVPHITAYLLTKRELDGILKEFTDLGIRNVLVIRGDMNNQSTSESTTHTFHYSIDVVKQIKKWAPYFSIGVAGFPEQHVLQQNFLLDMKYLAQKIEAGADYIITQLFFDNRDFFDFVECCKIFNITVPIIPGLTYIKDIAHMETITKLALGSRIPPVLLQHILHNKANNGIHWLNTQVKELLASEYTNLCHLYIFNTKAPFYNIIKSFQSTLHVSGDGDAH